MFKLILILSLSVASIAAFAGDGILVDSSDSAKLPKNEPMISDILSSPASDGLAQQRAIAPGGGGGQPVPEPATLVVLGTAGALALGRRLRRTS